MLDLSVMTRGHGFAKVFLPSAISVQGAKTANSLSPSLSNEKKRDRTRRVDHGMIEKNLEEVYVTTCTDKWKCERQPGNQSNKTNEISGFQIIIFQFRKKR